MNTLIRCPECGAPPVHRETCEACGFRFERVEVALDLRTDKSYDTLLEVEEYDAEHGVSEAPDPKIFATYQALMEGAGLTPAGSVLEIACGSGNLTASMLAAG